MSAVVQRPSIKFLSPQLADQIAAGEVIERPASVLKELIENSLDAHASRIDIDLTGGGIDRIRVTDNGDGIIAAELPLAVSRHATSKLYTLEDLLDLQTLGFRGEALASICSVSQWQLISAIADDNTAGKLSSEHPRQALTDHHPRGTTVQIEKLFYNTPARRKFLRAERTEFRHCDDVIRRMALARFDAGFFVKHNNRQVHRLPAVKDDIGRTRRVRQLCGEQFIRESLAIDYAYDGMRVWGWISTPAYTRQQTDLQYFYINGRVIRDRMINHAIRFAYQDFLPVGRQPAYVLHLEVEPDRFDVNVHPTKQEVRFRETRMVHDFLSRSLRQSLSADSGQVDQLLTGLSRVSDAYRYETAASSVQEHPSDYVLPGQFADSGSGLLYGRYLFRQHEGKVLLIDVQSVCARRTSEQWLSQINNGTVIQQPLLIPERIKFAAQQIAALENKEVLLARLGFDLALLSVDEAVVRFIPGVLTVYQSIPAIIHDLLMQKNDELSPDQLVGLLIEHKLKENKINMQQLVQMMLAEPQHFRDCWQEVTAEDIASLFRSQARHS